MKTTVRQVDWNIQVQLRYIELRMKYPIAALCLYETVAIATGRVPTITLVASRHRWLVPLLVGLTAWHLAAWPHD